MSETDLRTVERFILMQLDREEKIAPDVLLSRASSTHEVRAYSPGTITAVIWNLVAKGDVFWTSDHELAVSKKSQLARA